MTVFDRIFYCKEQVVLGNTHGIQRFAATLIWMDLKALASRNSKINVKMMLAPLGIS